MKHDIETFDLDDPESIAQLTRRQGEEISAASYKALLIELLSRHKVMTDLEVYAEVERVFGKAFSRDDLRVKQVGSNGSQRKWQNNLDWAKAVLTKQGRLLSRKKGKRRYYCLSDTLSLVLWIADGPKRPTKMKKRCPSCQATARLSAANCEVCGFEYPQPKPRTHKLPR